MEGGFSESTKNVLPLDSYPYELRIFEEWVSTGIVTFTSKWFCDWMSLYVFADYYDLPAFGRDIMSFLVEQRDKSQLFFFIGTYLDYVPSSSPLYRFCVEVCVHHLDCDRNFGRGGYEKLPKEFMWDVITGLSNKSANKPCPCCHKHCDFHKHDSEEEWQKSESCLGYCHEPFIYILNSMSAYQPGLCKAWSFYVSQATPRKTALDEQECLSFKSSTGEDKDGTKKTGKMRSALGSALWKRISREKHRWRSSTTYWAFEEDSLVQSVTEMCQIGLARTLTREMSGSTARRLIIDWLNEHKLHVKYFHLHILTPSVKHGAYKQYNIPSQAKQQTTPHPHSKKPSCGKTPNRIPWL